MSEVGAVSKRVMRARQRGSLTTERKNQIRARAGYCCQLCGKHCPRNPRTGKTELQVHHRKPVAMGGTHGDGNLRALCATCHRDGHEGNLSLIALRVFNSPDTLPASGGTKTGLGQKPSAGLMPITQEKRKMPFGISGGGGGKKDPLPAGRYLAQVVDFVEKDFPDFNDPEKTTTRIIWTLDVKASGSQTWQQHTIFTGTNFTDPKKVKDSKFISGLTKLVDALGLDIPVSQADLERFAETELIGRRFIINVKLNRLSGKLETEYDRVKQAPGVRVAEPEPEPEVFAPEPQRELAGVGTGAGRAVDSEEDDWDS